MTPYETLESEDVSMVTIISDGLPVNWISQAEMSVVGSDI